MFNAEIEKTILCYIIFEKENVDLTEKDFMIETHKKIIKAINNLKAKKQEISLLTIQEQMKNKDILKYLAIDLGEFIRGTSLETAYEILKKYTKQREVFALGKKMQLEIKDKENIDIYIEQLINELQKIEFQTNKEESFMQSVVKTVEQIEKNMKKKEDYTFYTGFFDLDRLTDGLHEGELTIIGARPRNWKNYIFLHLFLLQVKNFAQLLHLLFIFLFLS